MGKTFSSKRRCPAGFTLIEVLVALVILSTGIVLVLRAFETALAAVGQARDALVAGRLMREKILETGDALRASGAAVRDSDERIAFPGYGSYRRRCAVESVSPVGGMAQREKGMLYEVTVSVSRNGDRGSGQEASTLVFVPAETAR